MWRFDHGISTAHQAHVIGLHAAVGNIDFGRSVRVSSRANPNDGPRSTRRGSADDGTGSGCSDDGTGSGCADDGTGSADLGATGCCSP